MRIWLASELNLLGPLLFKFDNPWCFQAYVLCFSLPLSFASTLFMYRYDLGTRFRQKYVLRQNLFRGIPPINISDHVRVHTSNLHRTLFTASALIRGMFPSTPHFFNYYTDRLDVNVEKVDEHLRKSGQTLESAFKSNPK